MSSIQEKATHDLKLIMKTINNHELVDDIYAAFKKGPEPNSGFMFTSRDWWSEKEYKAKAEKQCGRRSGPRHRPENWRLAPRAKSRGSGPRAKGPGPTRQFMGLCLGPSPPAASLGPPLFFRFLSRIVFPAFAPYCVSGFWPALFSARLCYQLPSTVPV